MFRKAANTIDQYVLSFREGREEGFTYFFTNLYPSLCFFAEHLIKNKSVAEEIASAAFINIWQRPKQFQSAAHIRSYLFKVVRNDCIDWMNQQKKEQLLNKNIPQLSSFEENCYTAMVKAELLMQLNTSINTLPTECRKVFHLLYTEGKTVTETANELKLSVSTVKTQKRRGLDYLRKKIAF